MHHHDNEFAIFAKQRQKYSTPAPDPCDHLKIVELVVCHPVEGFLGLHDARVWGLDVAQGGHDDGAVVGGDQELTLPVTNVALTLLNLGQQGNTCCTHSHSSSASLGDGHAYENMIYFTLIV